MVVRLEGKGEGLVHFIVIKDTETLSGLHGNPLRTDRGKQGASQSHNEGRPRARRELHCTQTRDKGHGILFANFDFFKREKPVRMRAFPVIGSEMKARHGHQASPTLV